MKEVHLICNAHLDPIWQWEWEEGAAAALSTFRSAADLAEEFDYIFCHNEVTLYKYIEEYAPELFARIKELIRVGKWHIMGGWYLQPDCNMPQGESFVRQILVGRQYFMEKFGKSPTTAINFDPFGHTRGLVQIMKKCNQDSYLICRPGNDPIPGEQFLWEGFDGSRIKVEANVSYGTALGKAASMIRERIDTNEEEVVCVLWGVGNHGGGPSRKDLSDIKAMMEEGTIKMLHSTPETFFAQIDPQKVHDKSLRTWDPGCYTSMSKVKMQHARLENELFMAEKLCSVAAMRGLMEYPQAELDEVVEDLLNCQFHDVLPGSSIRAGEENGLRLIEHGLQILNHIRARAYFALSAMESKAKEGEYPILVLNPHPYEWETEVVCELTLADQNWSDTEANYAVVYDENGNIIPSQTVKEESNLNLDWRKRIFFRGKLKPLSLTRFSVYMNVEPVHVPQYDTKEKIIVDLPQIEKYVEIDGQTGLMTSYRVHGKEYIDQDSQGAFQPYFFKDNPDPWGKYGLPQKRVGTDPVPFPLMEQPDGPFEGLKPVQIIEDGEIYLGVECFFKLQNSYIRVEYDIYKQDPAVDIKIDVFANDINRMLKISLPVENPGTYFGQTAFGTEDLYMDARECVAQRFVGVREKNEKDCLTLFNRGTYGSHWENDTLYMSLLRTATYCAHPIDERPIIPTDRFVKKIDLGERNFAFRLTVAGEGTLEKLAAEFNQPPYACNVFPIDTDKCVPEVQVSVSDPEVTLITLKKGQQTEGYVLRLLNNYHTERTAVVNCNGASLELVFGRYEVKTCIYKDGGLTESDSLMI